MCERLGWTRRNGLRVVRCLLNPVSEHPRVRWAIGIVLLVWLALHRCSRGAKLEHMWWLLLLWILWHAIRMALWHQHRRTGMMRIALRRRGIRLLHREVRHLLRGVVCLLHSIVVEDSGRVPGGLFGLPWAWVRWTGSCLESDVCSTIGDRTEVEVGCLEDYALIVSIAESFAFDAVPTYRPGFVALYATLSARQAAGLGSFARQSSPELRFRRPGIRMACIVVLEIARSICTFGGRHGEDL